MFDFHIVSSDPKLKLLIKMKTFGHFQFQIGFGFWVSLCLWIYKFLFLHLWNFEIGCLTFQGLCFWLTIPCIKLFFISLVSSQLFVLPFLFYQGPVIIAFVFDFSCIYILFIFQKLLIHCLVFIAAYYTTLIIGIEAKNQNPIYTTSKLRIERGIFFLLPNAKSWQGQNSAKVNQIYVTWRWDFIYVCIHLNILQCKTFSSSLLLFLDAFWLYMGLFFC